MKKILMLGLIFGLGTFAFADTLYVMKARDVWVMKAGTSKIKGIVQKYENMKLDRFHSHKDNCYYYDSWGNLIYTVNGKTYCTSMFEVEMD